MTDIIRFKPRTEHPYICTRCGVHICTRCGGVAEADIWVEPWDEQLGIGLGGDEKGLVPICLGCAAKLPSFLADDSARADRARSDAEIAAVIDSEIVKWEEVQRKGGQVSEPGQHEDRRRDRRQASRPDRR